MIHRINFNRACVLIARWLNWCAVGLIVLCALLIALAFYRAAQDGRIPVEWGVCDENHGPWRHYYAGREVLAAAVMLPLYAGGASVLSLFLQPKLKTVLLLLTGLALFVLEIQFLFWLID